MSAHRDRCAIRCGVLGDCVCEGGRSNQAASPQDEAAKGKSKTLPNPVSPAGGERRKGASSESASRLGAAPIVSTVGGWL